MQVTTLHPDATIPTRGSEYAAGLDLYADHGDTINPGERVLIGTGIAIALPPFTAGLIWPRSGLATKQGVDVLAGVVDADYRGEVRVALINHGAEPVDIEPGDRIAQLLIQPLAMVDVEVVDELPETARGDGGFGSTA